MITAREINEKQFHDAWRGYDQEEVDDFLDKLAEALEQLQRENQSLSGRLAELDQKIETSRTSEEMLKKTLESAQVAAQEAITTARTKAEEIVREAEERATKAREELRMRVETAEEEVRRRTDEIEREQAARRQQIQDSVSRLEEFEADLKRKLRAFLQQEISSLEVLAEPPESRRIEQVPEADVDAETFDQAEDSAGQVEDFDEEPAEVESVEVIVDDEMASDDVGDAPAGSSLEIDTTDEPSLDDFRPYEDVDDAFGPARRRRKGLFHRRDRDADVDVEVSPEEV